MTQSKKKKVRVLKVDPQATGAKEGAEETLIFGKKNYRLLIVAFVLVAIGLLLMSGGRMPSPDVWDESRIYSFRRITLAPIVILSGFVVGLWAIFKR